MNTVLKNNQVWAEIKSNGAELVSFKKLDTGCDYIWKGDPKYWASHSPVLFPIVCALNNGETRIDGNIYKIGNHGFVRKDEFQLVESDESRAVFKHSFNEKTLSMYPYKYELYIIYTLLGNTLNVKYKVDNADDKDIYFQIGTHPGFNCPLSENEDFEDYYLEFENNETLERFFMNGSNVLVSDKSEIILRDRKILPLSHEMFEKGALVFRKINSGKVTLKSRKSSRSVSLYYENLPYMGIWQAKNAPFICIEPWYGIADMDNFTGEFKEKEMIVVLEKGKSFECLHKIEIN